jgi:hypothetical protein
LEEKEKEAVSKPPPLDIKSLSVLTLSSPDTIKAIKPPSPKGDKKMKPWEKAKKMKTLKDETT